MTLFEVGESGKNSRCCMDVWGANLVVAQKVIPRERAQ